MYMKNTDIETAIESKISICLTSRNACFYKSLKCAASVQHQVSSFITLHVWIEKKNPFVSFKLMQATSQGSWPGQRVCIKSCCINQHQTSLKSHHYAVVLGKYDILDDHGQYKRMQRIKNVLQESKLAPPLTWLQASKLKLNLMLKC